MVVRQSQVDTGHSETGAKELIMMTKTIMMMVMMTMMMHLPLLAARVVQRAGRVGDAVLRPGTATVFPLDALVAVREVTRRAEAAVDALVRDAALGEAVRTAPLPALRAALLVHLARRASFRSCLGKTLDTWLEFLHPCNIYGHIRTGTDL